MPASPKIEKVAAPAVDKLRAMAAAVVQAAGEPARPAGYRPRYLPSPALAVTPPAVVAPPVVVAPAPVVVAPQVVAPPVAATEPAVRKALSLSRRTVGIAAVGAGAVIVTVLALSGRSETSLPRAPVLASVRMPQELPPVAPQQPKVAAAPSPAPAPAPASDPGKSKLDQGQDQGQDQAEKTVAAVAPVRLRGAVARAAGRKRGAAAPRTVAAAAPEKAKAADEPGGVSDGTNSELDQLVKTALAGKEKRGETRAEEPAAQPGLTRNDIMASMKPLRPRIKECYRQFGEKGMALVQVQVGDKGQVASAKVAGSFAGTPTGSCVEAAVKTVRFPQSAGMNFQYPFPVR